MKKSRNGGDDDDVMILEFNAEKLSVFPFDPSI
jgi:hypothetical protein